MKMSANLPKKMVTAVMEWHSIMVAAVMEWHSITAVTIFLLNLYYLCSKRRKWIYVVNEGNGFM